MARCASVSAAFVVTCSASGTTTAECTAVTPADICAPWLASVPRAQPVPPPSSEKEAWNGSVDIFNAWWAKTERTLFNHSLAPMAMSTRTTHGQLNPTHRDDPGHAEHVAFPQDRIFGAAIQILPGWLAPTKQRAAQINAEREVHLQQARGRWCAAVIVRICGDELARTLAAQRERTKIQERREN